MDNRTDLSPSQRRHTARRALDELGHQRNEHVLLSVRCGRSHHVATVFDTTAGPVYQATFGPHAHGRRDFIDEAHHADRNDIRYVDLLDGDRYTEDRLPAGCECGSHELSRAQLRHAIHTHQRTIQLT